VEQKVREEVTEEMELQMKEMDTVFAIRIENERIAVEERCVVCAPRLVALGVWLCRVPNRALWWRQP
jgi:hypothetical protein